MCLRLFVCDICVYTCVYAVSIHSYACMIYVYMHICGMYVCACILLKWRNNLLPKGERTISVLLKGCSRNESGLRSDLVREES